MIALTVRELKNAIEPLPDDGRVFIEYDSGHCTDEAVQAEADEDGDVIIYGYK